MKLVVASLTCIISTNHCDGSKAYCLLYCSLIYFNKAITDYSIKVFWIS